MHCSNENLDTFSFSKFQDNETKFCAAKLSEEAFQHIAGKGASASTRDSELYFVASKERESPSTAAEKQTTPEAALAKAPESLDDRIRRHLGAEIHSHLTATDRDWDWLIAHQDQLARGLMAAAEEGDFHRLMTEVNRRCPHILFEDNPRPATRPVGVHLDYTETATHDWLIKMERGFLRPNNQLMNYVRWSDYTTNISR
jgi:hypothetical protein